MGVKQRMPSLGGLCFDKGDLAIQRVLERDRLLFSFHADAVRLRSPRFMSNELDYLLSSRRFKTSI